MRKLIAMLLTLCLVPCAGGCAQTRTLRVTATFYPLYVALLNITRGVEGVEIACLTPPQAGCLHDYQMTAADRRRLADSNIIVMNGAGLETFLTKLLPELSARVIDASEGIPLLSGEHGDNPHVWVSVSCMMEQVENIAAALGELDQAHKKQYLENARAYRDRLAALRFEMAVALGPARGKSIVTFHEAFDYFAEEFGFTVAAVVETDEGNVPSAKELAEVAETIRKEGVAALFAEPQYSDKSVQILARETGVPLYVLDPVVSGKADPTDYDAYLRIMEENLRVLEEALL